MIIPVQKSTVTSVLLNFSSTYPYDPRTRNWKKCVLYYYCTIVQYLLFLKYVRVLSTIYLLLVLRTGTAVGK